MSSIATESGNAGSPAVSRRPTLDAVDRQTRWQLHLIAVAAVLFLSFYGRLVCPFVDSLSLARLLAGLAAICLAQICLREALYRFFPAPWGRASVARHGMYLSVLSWLIAGALAMALHMSLYPDFPIESHAKLLSGYWALGGGILSQLEYIALERYFRRQPSDAPAAVQAVERFTRRLMESYAVFTLVPSIILVMLMFRLVYQGHAQLGDAIEVAFVGVVFVGTALLVASRYGAALHDDCNSIRSALTDVADGKYDIALDSSRPDELGMVARSLTDMGQDLIRRERREARLLEITSAISEQLHLDKLLTEITTGATQLLDAERSTLFLLDEKQNRLWSRVAEGIDSEIIYLAPDSGLAGAAFSGRETINLTDAYADPRFNADFDRKTGFHTRNMLCMPVINKTDKCLGVIQVLNKNGASFDERDERRLRAMCAQAAIAIENAQMFEDILNLKNYDESILKSLSNGVISFDSDQRVAKVNAAAQRILGWHEDDVVGSDAAAVFGPENDWIQPILDRVSKSGESDHSLDVDIATTGTDKVSVNLAAVPLISINDEFIGQMLILEDLSAEKRVRGTMARYMPKQVVDRVLKGHRDVLEGRAQRITLLFTDIRSFTSISETIGPRATVAMLNEYFTDMVDIIDHRHGILDKYIGDAIMAAFGAPFESEADEQNAVDAANEMMLALAALNARRADAGKLVIEHGIGINTGEAVAGSIGSPKRMDYTVIGDAVNLTARLESATKFYGTPILVSEYTLDRLERRAHFREVDMLRVKGKAEPVRIFEAYGYRADRIGDDDRRAFDIQANGMHAFRRQDWHGAKTLFERAAALLPDDKLARLYLARIQHYQQSPPGDHWDGVWTMQTK